MTRWFEDIVIGEPFPLGSHDFTEAEIIRFGKLYDPQYFHVDPEAAKFGPFGGLVASGWHTIAIGHRKMVDGLDAESERLRGLGQEPGIPGPSPGVDKMEFKLPVRPGDTITYGLVVTSKRPSNSLPGWGLLISTIEGTNQHGELVYRGQLASFVKLRDFRPPLGLRAALLLRRLLGKPTLA
jgi:acyl dehydratase